MGNLFFLLSLIHGINVILAKDTGFVNQCHTNALALSGNADSITRQKILDAVYAPRKNSYAKLMEILKNKNDDLSVLYKRARDHVVATPGKMEDRATLMNDLFDLLHKEYLFVVDFAVTTEALAVWAGADYAVVMRPDGRVFTIRIDQSFQRNDISSWVPAFKTKDANGKVTSKRISEWREGDFSEITDVRVFPIPSTTNAN